MLEELLELARAQERRLAGGLLTLPDLARIASVVGSVNATLPSLTGSSTGSVGAASGFSGVSGFSGFQPDAYQSGAVRQMHPSLMANGPQAGTEKSPLPLAADNDRDDKKPI